MSILSLGKIFLRSNDDNIYLYIEQLFKDGKMQCR